MGQLGDLLSELCERVAVATGVRNEHGARLAALFPDAPRSLVELQLRVSDPRPQLVLGFSAPACAAAMVEAAGAFAGEPAREVAEAWRARIEPLALDWGVKVPIAETGCQLYARWQVEVDEVVDIVGHLGGTVPHGAAGVRALLAQARRTFVQMYGVELGGAAPRHVCYVSTPSLPGKAADLRGRLGRVVASRLGAAASRELWPPIGDALIRDVEEQIYLSFEPESGEGWLKIDVGERALDELPAIIDAMGAGVDVRPTVAILEELGAQSLSHLGVRLVGDAPPEVTCYAHVHP